MLKKIGVLFVIGVIAITIALMSGCNSKKEYTIDEPFDFGSLSNENKPDTATAAPVETSEPESQDATSAPATGGDKTDDVLPTASPKKDETQTPAPGNQEGSQGGSPASGATNDTVEDKTFIDVADENKVPEEIVEKMTTNALLETYMNYPMIKLLMFEQDPMESYKKWKNGDDSCTGQLIERDDSVEAILSKYKSLVDQEKKDHLYENEDLDMEFQIDWIELLLMQDSVKEKATLAQQKEILSYAKRRDENVMSNGYAVSDLYPSLADVYKLG